MKQAAGAEVRTRATNRRKILCIFPAYTDGFAVFRHAFEFFPDVVAFMPPQGLLTVAAYLPTLWEVRFIDENVRRAEASDFAWAEVVLTSGMHAQQHLLHDIAARAHRAGKLAVLGGPSVSACPEFYPDFDLLHVGEIGDATDQLVAHLDASCERPASQRVFTTTERVPLDALPIPAYRLIRAASYLMLNVQWSSGCPFTCEFCDIPALYGRVPRFKSADRLIAELDVLAALDGLGVVFFVDDNLIGNKKAFKQLLPHLVAWQKRNGYRLRFTGECTLNLAQDKELLALMREAHFIDLFFGIETPEEDALRAIDKPQNLRLPLLDAVRTINSYGIGLHAGIIVGLDTDTDETVEKILRFIEDAKIPTVALNVLYAPPKTPLHRRMEAEGRLRPSVQGGSNVVFKDPEEVVLGRWRQLVERALEPGAVLARYRHNALHTYPNRVRVPLSRKTVSLHLAKSGLFAIATMIKELGVRAHYRREFWKLALDLARAGYVEHLLYVAPMAYHLTRFRDEVRAGEVNPCIHAETPFGEALGQPPRKPRSLPVLQS